MIDLQPRPSSRTATRTSTLARAFGLLVALLVALGTLPAVAQSPSAGGTSTWPLEGTTWLLDHATSPAVASQAGDAAVVTLHLVDGTASGAAGCNRYTSEVQVSDTSITFGPPATTLMLCEDPVAALETAYLAALATVTRFAIAGDVLVLSDEAGAPRLAYLAEPPPPVVGSWTATGYRAATDELVTPYPDAPLTLDLGIDGTARGWTGCDALTGSYLVEGDAIRIGQLASTATRCTVPGASVQEWYFLDALDRARSWTIEDGVLAFVDEAGATLLTLAQGTTGTLTASWSITGYLGPDGLTAPVDGSQPRLDLFANGTLFGWTGCNTIVTTYRVSGGRVEVAPLGTTASECGSEELTAQDAAIKAALPFVAGWQLDGPGLALLDGSGVVQLTLLGIGASITPVATPTPSPTQEPTEQPTEQPTPKATAKPTPSSVEVPDIVDMLEADGLVELGAAGLAAGTRKSVYSAKIAAGRIHSTDPKAGVMVKPGTAIDYKVSKGPEPTAKPTAKPTPKPTAKPTPKPTAKPTPKPTAKPTPKPTDTPVDLLEGTAWVLTEYHDANGEVIALPSDVTLPTAGFVAGVMAGTTGCNAYSTSYQIHGVQKLTLGPVVTTGLVCVEPAGTMEHLFLDALGVTDRFTLSSDGQTLRLRGKSPTPILYFAPAQP